MNGPLISSSVPPMLFTERIPTILLFMKEKKKHRPIGNILKVSWKIWLFLMKWMSTGISTMLSVMVQIKINIILMKLTGSFWMRS